MTRVLPLIPDDLTERRRAKAKARTIASIGAHRIAKNEKAFPGGHLWRRYADHESLVLRVLQGRCFG